MHHIGIAIKKENLDKYKDKYISQGAELLYEGDCIYYLTHCVFLKVADTIIELIHDLKGQERVNRFIKKHGEGKIHHLAYLSTDLNEDNSVEGAMPGMIIEFIDLNKTYGTLIEKVKFNE